MYNFISHHNVIPLVCHKADLNKWDLEKDGSYAADKWIPAVLAPMARRGYDAGKLEVMFS